MRKILIYALLLALSTAIFLSSCSDDEGGTQTIVELAQGDSDLDSLVSALTQAGLVNTLNSAGTFTVFAPTNAAFANLYTTLGVSGADQVATDLLTTVLLYHVLGTEFTSSQLADGFFTTQATGPESTNQQFYLTTSGGVQINGASTVTTADISASNGTIHKVNAVFLPQTVVGLATAFPDFTALIDAAVYAGLDGTLADEANTLTVFAPTDAAFTTFLNKLGVTSITMVDSATVAGVLLKHVIIGANVESSELSAGSVNTANGPIDIGLSPSATINDTINITTTDIQGSNGIIHVIDKVIE